MVLNEVDLTIYKEKNSKQKGVKNLMNVYDKHCNRKEKCHD